MHTQEMELEEEYKEWFQCGICQKKFSVIFNFYEHFKEHGQCAYSPEAQLEKFLHSCCTSLPSNNHIMGSVFEGRSAIGGDNTKACDLLSLLYSRKEDIDRKDTFAAEQKHFPQVPERPNFKCAACKQVFPGICALKAHLNGESFYFCEETMTCFPKNLSCCFSTELNFFITVELHRKSEDKDVENGGEQSNYSNPKCSAVQGHSSSCKYDSCSDSLTSSKERNTCISGETSDIHKAMDVDPKIDGHVETQIDKSIHLNNCIYDDAVDRECAVNIKNMSDANVDNCSADEMDLSYIRQELVMQDDVENANNFSVLECTAIQGSHSEIKQSNSHDNVKCDIDEGATLTNHNHAINKVGEVLNMDQVHCDHDLMDSSDVTGDTCNRHIHIYLDKDKKSKQKSKQTVFFKKENKLISNILDNKQTHRHASDLNKDAGNVGNNIQLPEENKTEELDINDKTAFTNLKQETRTEKNHVNHNSVGNAAVNDPSEGTSKGKRNRGRPRKSDSELKYPRKQKWKQKSTEAVKKNISKLKLSQSERVECSHCGKLFLKNNLRNHIKACTMDRRFSCDECGANFATKGVLSSHKKCVHEKANQYQCEFCGASFFVPSKLAKHLRNHTGERNFVCSFCNKTFKHIEYLRKHQKIHTGVKDQVCSTCGKMFYTQWNLSQHELTHRDVGAFQCARCNRNFTTKRSLKKHQELSCCHDDDDPVPRSVKVILTKKMEELSNRRLNLSA